MAWVASLGWRPAGGTGAGPRSTGMAGNNRSVERFDSVATTEVSLNSLAQTINDNATSRPTVIAQSELSSTSEVGFRIPDRWLGAGEAERDYFAKGPE